jgi:hypothetical protein
MENEDDARMNENRFPMQRRESVGLAIFPLRGLEFPPSRLLALRDKATKGWGALQRASSLSASLDRTMMWANFIILLTVRK